MPSWLGIIFIFFCSLFVVFLKNKETCLLCPYCPPPLDFEKATQADWFNCQQLTALQLQADFEDLVFEDPPPVCLPYEKSVLELYRWTEQVERRKWKARYVDSDPLCWPGSKSWWTEDDRSFNVKLSMECGEEEENDEDSQKD